MEFLLTVTLLTIFFAYFLNKDKRDSRRAIEKARADGTLYEEYTFIARFPNPATSSLEDTKEFLDNEVQLAVLYKYRSVAKELGASDEVESLIQRRVDDLEAIYL